MKSNKYEIRGQENLDNALKLNLPILLCVWHGRMLFPIFYVIKNKLKPWAIASPHNDGKIISSILSWWGIKIISGSSNQKAKNAVEQMIKIFSNDKKAIIAITNDGPKGPAHIAKENSLKIAKQYNAQIITITGDCTKKWVFDSWDKFYLPKPFGKIIINIAPLFKNYKDKNLVASVSKYMTENEILVSEEIKKC
tara:strand:- start:5027 stop:5611 length:585 start_codon:yes stop_codon:yes gene_type:complete